MTAGRGNHQLTETEAPSAHPATGDLVVQDPAQEATPLSWWVKTIASWTLLAATVGLLGALVVVPRLTGSTVYTVLTGSMQPSYPPGTMIVVRPTPGAELKAGDVITFQPESGDPSVVTHRIVSIFLDAQGHRRFITKGDANQVQDDTQLVDGQIRGRLLYSVPYLGHVTSLIPGSARSIALFVVAGGLGGYALWMWAGSLRDRRRAKDDAEPDDAEPIAATAPIATAPPRCHTCGQQLDRGAAQVDSRLPAPYRADRVADVEITRPIPITNH